MGASSASESMGIEMRGFEDSDSTAEWGIFLLLNNCIVFAVSEVFKSSSSLPDEYESCLKFTLKILFMAFKQEDFIIR